MTLRNRWLGLAVVALLSIAPATALARHGADDALPQFPEPELEPSGLARHGADDALPQFPEPELPAQAGVA